MQARGFVLLEATAALFVVAVGVLGLVQFIENSGRELRTAHEHEIAGRLLRNEMAVLTAQPFGQLQPRSSQVFATPAPEMQMLVKAAPRVTIAAHPDYPETLREVTVAIDWLSTHGRRVHRSLSTLVVQEAD